MTEEFIAKLVGNIGVPAAICLYTLFEVNKNVKRLAESIDRLSDDLKNRVCKLENDLHDLTAEVKSMIRRGHNEI